MKEVLGEGRLSLKRLTAEGFEGGLLYWRTWVINGRLWRRTSLFMRAQFDNLEVERLSLWELCEGNLEGGLPFWGPWRVGRKGSGDEHLFP
jgi:hypothetical protein